MTLALIISEELKNAPGGIPLTTLRALIRHDSTPPPSGVHSGGHSEGIHEGLGLDGGERGLGVHAAVHSRAAVHSEPAISFGRGADKLIDFFLEEAELEGDQTDDQRAAARARFERWRADLDARVRALPNSNTVVELQGQVKRLNERIAELEQRLSSETD